jgi:hypothetical protein
MLHLGISVKEIFNFLQFYLSTICFSTVVSICYHGITLNGECGLNNSRWEKLIKQWYPHWQKSQSVTYSDEDSCCVFVITSLSWFQDKCDTIPKCNSITAVDDKPHDASSQTREYASFDTCSFGCTQFFCISVNIILMLRIKYILSHEKTAIIFQHYRYCSKPSNVFICTQVSHKEA